MAMIDASRRLSCRSNSASLLRRLLRSALSRSLSRAFREERDTFGPILVPSDKPRDHFKTLILVLSVSKMPEPIIRAFGILKKCAAKDAALDLGVLTAQEFDELVVPEKMIGPSD